MNYKISSEDYQISSDLDKSNLSYIYGEVNSSNILNILKNIEYDNRLFLDIGSGCGKLIIEIASKLDIFCTGIEIDINRFNKSLKIQQQKSLFNVEFINNDFRNIYFGNYDILYCCNTIFSKEDNKNLYQKIIKEFNGYAILFDYDFILKQYLIDKKNIITSWSKKVTVYIFYIK